MLVGDPLLEEADTGADAPSLQEKEASRPVLRLGTRRGHPPSRSPCGGGRGSARSARDSPGMADLPAAASKPSCRQVSLDLVRGQRVATPRMRGG